MSEQPKAKFIIDQELTITTGDHKDQTGSVSAYEWVNSSYVYDICLNVDGSIVKVNESDLSAE